MPEGGKITVFDSGIVARVSQGVRFIFTGKTPNAWFGPGQPLAPVAQEVAGGLYDYPFSANIQYTPRGESPVSFDQLRALADHYDLLRLLIEKRKDQIEKLSWKISAKDADSQTTDLTRIASITDFLSMPDKQHSWTVWLRALLEDLFVTDAVTIYPRKAKDGSLYSLDLLDGTTIKRLIDSDGRIPLPPSPAYQQILKGQPAADFSATDIVYAPRNMRTHRTYGYPPVEQIIMTVNIGIRRQLSQYQFYSDGNLPDALIGMPKEWTPAQISEWQKSWDALLAGNTAMRRHGLFVPGEFKYQPTRDPQIFDKLDEWLARVCCFAFSVPASAFVATNNRATAETLHEQSLKEGIEPLKVYLSQLMNLILVRYLNGQDLQFSWSDERDVDVMTQANVDKIYVSMGVKSIDDIRNRLGDKPIGAKNMVLTAQGYLPIPVAGAPAPAPENSVDASAAPAALKLVKKNFPA